MTGEATLWFALGAIDGLLGGLGLGASIDAYVAHKLRERAEQRQEKREANGLLRLLLGEIEHNTAVANSALGSSSVMFAAPRLTDMKTETWRSTRVRAAQLAPDGLLRSLEAYYTPLETLLTLVGGEDAAQESANSWLRAALAEDLGEQVKLDRPTLYARDTLNAQKQVRKQIREHLGIKEDDDPES